MVRYWKVRQTETSFTTPLVRTNRYKGEKQRLSSPKLGDGYFCQMACYYSFRHGFLKGIQFYGLQLGGGGGGGNLETT